MKGILDKEMEKQPKPVKLRFDYFFEDHCPSTHS